MTSTEGTTEDTKQQARHAASTAGDEAQRVAGVAGEELRNVTDQAKEQARSVVDDAMTQVDEQSRAQRDRLVSTLQTFGDDLEEMASTSGRSGLATDVARQVAERARSVSSRIDGREPADLLEEVRSFARRRPGTFLLGSLAAGVVAGRLIRGAKAATGGNGTSSSGWAGSAQPASAPVPPPAAPLLEPEADLGTEPDYAEDPLDPAYTGSGTGTAVNPAMPPAPPTDDVPIVDPANDSSVGRYAR